MRALGGAPGVQSARCRRTGSDTRNNAADRSAAESPIVAHYACVLVLMRHAADPESIWPTAWQAPSSIRPIQRFGYDPYFEDLTTDDRLSCRWREKRAPHRGKAMRLLLVKLCDER